MASEAEVIGRAKCSGMLVSVYPRGLCPSSGSRLRFAGETGTIPDAVQTMDFLVFTMSPAVVSTCSMCVGKPYLPLTLSTQREHRPDMRQHARFALPVPPRASDRKIHRDTGACPRQSQLVPKNTPAVGIFVQVPSCSRTQLHVSFGRLVAIGAASSGANL